MREKEKTKLKRGKKKQWGRIGRISGWHSHAVGVSSRSELLDATVGTNVFNAVAEGNFVLNGIFTTTGLLFAAFGLHYNIHAFLFLFLFLFSEKREFCKGTPEENKRNEIVVSERERERERARVE